MAAIPEAIALEVALQALNDPPDPTHLAPLSRAVIRAADDLELVAEETANRLTRQKLLNHVVQARKAVTAARKLARQTALTLDRTKLLEAVPEISKMEAESDAAKVAREINDSLRRTTAIVSEEVDRSRAAGNVIDESTRRLRMTRDQHGRYGESLSSGADTLKGIRRSEMVANFLIVLSFAIFFLAAAYVTKRRLANSNISTFVLRPGMKIASLPVRILGWMVRAIRVTELKANEVDHEKVSSPAQEADEAQKAKEGREEVGTVGEHEENVKAGAGEDVKKIVGSSEKNWSCDANRKCTSRKNDESDRQNEEETNDTHNSSNDSDPGHDQDIIEDVKSNNVEGSGALKEDPISEKGEASIGRSQSSDFGSGQDGDFLAETNGEDIAQEIDNDASSEGKGEGDSELHRVETDTEQATIAAGHAKE